MDTLQERLIWARAMKSERDRAEFTQQDLADKARVSQGNIAHLESGRTKTSRNVIAIAEALGVQPRWLATGKGAPYAEGTDEYKWAENRYGRPGLIDAPETTTAQPVPVTTAPVPARSLIWVDSYDLLLLTLAHATDDDGREKILRTAHRVPRVVGIESIRNQS